MLDKVKTAQLESQTSSHRHRPGLYRSTPDNRRRDKRVDHPFVVRLRDASSGGVEGSWDVTTARNISKGGLLINSSNRYPPGYEVEIRIRNPILGKDIHCWGTVRRCAPTERMKDVFEVAFRISRVEANGQAAFVASIEFFEEL